MIVSTQDLPNSVAYTFHDGAVVRVPKRNHRPGNAFDAAEMAARAYLIRAAESSAVKELTAAMSSLSHYATVLKAHAMKIEAGDGPLAEAMQAHRLTNPAEVAAGLRKAAKEIRRAVHAACESGFFEAASPWNEMNLQAEEESPAEPPVNRLRVKLSANGHPKAELNGKH